MQGTKMHGVINKHYVEKFRSLTQEGNVYIITNVKVTSAAKFRPVDNDKVLSFLPTKTLEKIEDTEDIPRHGFKFSANIVFLFLNTSLIGHTCTHLILHSLTIVWCIYVVIIGYKTVQSPKYIYQERTYILTWCRSSLNKDQNSSKLKNSGIYFFWGNLTARSLQWKQVSICNWDIPIIPS